MRRLDKEPFICLLVPLLGILGCLFAPDIVWEGIIMRPLDRGLTRWPCDELEYWTVAVKVDLKFPSRIEWRMMALLE